MPFIPFQHIDWSSIKKVEHKGESGTSYWQTLQFGGLRIRMLEYSKGFSSDHWCLKGHIVYCLDGSFISELRTGEKIKLSKGESYVLSDDVNSHKSTTENGAILFVVDGDFLK